MSGFVSGAAMGAGGGLAGGFVTGAGNAFMRGEDLGGALTSGLTSGLIGGVSGGLIGGTLGGIKALLEHKSFWDGATVTKTSKVLADVGVLPKTIQDGPYDCASATLETIEKFRGGPRTQANFRALISETNGVRPDKIIFAAGYETTPQYATAGAISRSLQTGKLGILSLTTDQAGLNHAVVPSKIIVNQILREYSWKNSVSKVFYEIFGMNPATNTMFMEKLFRGTPEMLFKLQYFPLN